MESTNVKVILLVAGLSLAACEQQTVTVNTNSFFISQDSVSGHSFTSLLDSLDSLPKQINDCDVSKANNGFILQCNDEKMRFTDQQIVDALSGSAAFNANDEFIKFDEMAYSWKSENISCELSIAEKHKVFELFCNR